MKFKNKNKIFLTPEGEFKIDNNYNIIEGIHKGKHYREVVADFDQLRVVHNISPSMAILEVIKWSLVLLLLRILTKNIFMRYIKEFEGCVGYFVKDSWFVMERKDGSRTIIPNNVRKINIPREWQDEI